MAAGGKIEALNTALRGALPHLQEISARNPFVQIFVRALVFADGARWHIAYPTPVDELRWTDVPAAGQTDLGAALQLLVAQLRTPPMEPRAFPPVIVLISDGQPTDEYDAQLASLLAEPWGRRAVRLAIAIGEDADLAMLQEFIADETLHPFKANDPEHLAYLVRFTSVVASRLVSEPTPDGKGLSQLADEPAHSGPESLLAW
jgi:uncharacterized protein YegL